MSANKMAVADSRYQMEILQKALGVSSPALPETSDYVLVAIRFKVSAKEAELGIDFPHYFPDVHGLGIATLDTKHVTALREKSYRYNGKENSVKPFL
jgi:hypothetical protein